MFVIGGGEFANLIRKYDKEIEFSKDVTHETAIDSMDILAKLLNDKLAFTEISYTIEEAKSISDLNKIPIMICSDILKENEPFAHSWDVTSDDVNKLLTFDESSIDLMLPTLLIEYGLDCYVVNGEYPERVLSMMNNENKDSFEYTFIHNE